jgi:hypothetical protein
MKYDTYEEVVDVMVNAGYSILDFSNGLSWVYFYKIDKIRKMVTLAAWYRSDGELQRISNIDDFLLMDILKELK